MKRRLLVLGFIICLSSTCANALSILTSGNIVCIDSKTIIDVTQVSLIDYVEGDKVTLIHLNGTIKSIPTTYSEFKQIQNAIQNAKNMYQYMYINPYHQSFNNYSSYNPNPNPSPNPNPNPQPNPLPNPQPNPSSNTSTQRVYEPNPRLPMFGI